MRKPRPATFNPAQALHLIASDRTGSPLSCPSCSGQIERTPNDFPPPPRCQVTLRCRACGRLARYIAGAALNAQVASACRPDALVQPAADCSPTAVPRPTP